MRDPVELQKLVKQRPRIVPSSANSAISSTSTSSSSPSSSLSSASSSSSLCWDRTSCCRSHLCFSSPRRCKTGASSSSPRAVSRCLSFPPATHLDHSNLLHYSPASAQSDLWQLWPLEPRPSSPSTTSLLLAPEPFQPGRYFNTQQHQSVSFLGNQQ